MADDWYQQFLNARSSDYEDFSQHYSAPDDDDYDAREEGLTRDVSLDVFGVAWNALTPQDIARTILRLQDKASAYKKKPKPWRKSGEGKQERDAVEAIHHHVNIAIFFKVPRPNHKQFMHQSDRISQIIAEE